MSSFEVEPLTDDDVDEAIAVINAAFGFDRDDDWFVWKHRQGPWGPSSGLVARDGRGIAGVRVLLPWRFRGPAGTLDAYRAVEAATAPRAQGRGVFSLLNRHIMERATDAGPTMLFSTPNANSRGGYAKLGWSWLSPVPHVWRPVRPRRWRVSLLESEDAIARYQGGPPPGRIATDWSPAALTWRLDPRSGHRYEVIAAGERRAGVAFRRLDTACVSAVLPLLSWGGQRERRRVLAEAAWRTRTAVLLDTGSPGGAPASTAWGLPRGESLLAVWPTPLLGQEDWAVTEVSHWRVGFADLENVL
jgi:GNAT superfamily N-acetyltransferase